jgi:hypothetical protein
MHNVFDACRSITRESGRGLDPVKWHRADRRVPFGAQKTWVTLTGCKGVS